VELGYLIQVIGETGGLLDYGVEIDRLMKDYRQTQVHHIDLLLKPT
jgi:hypothetical protein